VPGSGTDQLTGLSGKFTLNLDDIRAGKHVYDLAYSLPEAK
jgi:hypothetical protein